MSPVPKSGHRCCERGALRPQGHHGWSQQSSCWGSTWARAFGSKDESPRFASWEVRAPGRGGGKVEEAPAGVPGTSGSRAWRRGTGLRVKPQAGSPRGQLWAAAGCLLGPLARWGWTERLWPGRKSQIPLCVLSWSPMERPGLASGLPTPSSLPQAPVQPDTVHQRCREPFIR